MRAYLDRRSAAMALVYIGVSAVVLGAYLWASHQTYGLGFPLDDAWIHQTYARNFAETGQWAFVSGLPSAGSTAPLWTMSLTIGYFLGIEPRTWTYLVGGALLFLTGWFSAKWLSIRLGDPAGTTRWLGLLVILEWHLAWAAVSGMEIIILALLVVCVFASLESRSSSFLRLGAMIGLGVWIRPDALSLLLPVWWHAYFSEQRDRSSFMRRIILTGLGFFICFAPYLAFNFSLSGTIWPSTFYAKQAEYSIMRTFPFISRLLRQLTLPLIGAGVLLVPGILWKVLDDIRLGKLSNLAPLLWVIAFLSLYALRLPVTYQYGRYAMPTIAVILVLGMEGLLRWIRPASASFMMRISSRAWPGAVFAGSLAFLIVGARVYARDVAIIESEMVQTARWISSHTEPEALIAAHDIGALGYFGQRELVDLAGLVSPEVIPFMRDEARLAQFLNERGADYLMTFPDWYPELVQEIEPVYVTDARFSPNAGGENMVVYKWSLGGLPRE